MKGKVAKCDHREYGFAQVQISKIGGENKGVDALFQDLGDELQVRHFSKFPKAPIPSQPRSQVWMSHGDQLSEMPEEFHIIGRTATAPYAAVAHNSKPFYGIQFHPEVTHSKRGKEVIKNFVIGICGCKQHWTMVSLSSCRVHVFVFGRTGAH